MVGINPIFSEGLDMNNLNNTDCHLWDLDSLSIDSIFKNNKVYQSNSINNEVIYTYKCRREKIIKKNNLIAEIWKVQIRDRERNCFMQLKKNTCFYKEIKHHKLHDLDDLCFPHRFLIKKHVNYL